MLFTLIPHSLFEQYLRVDFLPNKYWFVAIPTHFFVTLVYIFILIKAYNYSLVLDPPVKEGIIIYLDFKNIY